MGYFIKNNENGELVAFSELPQDGFDVYVDELPQEYYDKIDKQQDDLGYISELTKSDWKVIRHRDQKDAGILTSLTEAEYLMLLQYRQDKRDSIT